MGFNSVYKALQDVFPQIDSRLLRAVAIEHSKDADLAVEVVLVEIIPNLSPHSQSQSSTSGFSNKIENSPSLSEVVVDGGKTVHFDATMGSEQSTQSVRFSNDANVTGYIKKQPTSQYVNIFEPNSPVIQRFNPGSSSQTKFEKKVVSREKKPVNDKRKRDEGLFGQIASCLIEKDSAVTGNIQKESVSISEPKSPVTQEQDSVTSPKTKSEKKVVSTEKKPVNEKREEGLFSQIASCLIENDPYVKTEASSESVIVPEPNSPVTQKEDSGSSRENSPTVSVYEKVLNDNQDKGLFGKIAACLVFNENDYSVTQEQEPNSPTKTTSESENNVVVTEENTEDESMKTSKLTKSDQVCNIELLEDIIEEARNEKKTLVSTMDAVVELMREVEDKEKAAEEAKEEATRDCSHIFAKVDELKEALGRAKEANDMHSGEVYAEKAILATEMKELQVRLFTLSDERNKSLGILNEMRESLEIRLATALKEIETAESQKVEKEKTAREALTYQESQLEKVVEESKKLQREAEENSKLQEFLMDRGHAIDILQGEISVKCQDVMLLKEKLDKRVPLSLSLSSSQTSSILAAASPSSSFRSHTTTTVAAEQEGEMYETPKKTLDFDESYNKTPWSGHTSRAESPKGQEKQSDSWKLLLNDDDWELFDKGELATGA